MRSRCPMVVLAFASVMFSLEAAAQFPMGGMGGPSTRPIRLMIGGGMTVPTGEFEKSHDLGVHAQGALLINLGGLPIKIRPELTFTRFNLKDIELPGLPTAPVGGTSQMIGGLGNIELGMGMGPLRPYVFAGVGMINFKTTTDANDGSSESESASKTEFAVDGGAGIRLKLGALEGFIEGRVNNVYTDKGALNYRDVRTIPVTFGLIF
jgi:hypothetical protein